MRNFLLIALMLGLTSCGLQKNKPLTEKDMSAYLLVYFLDNTHSLHMALSEDGYTFTAVNEGKAV